MKALPAIAVFVLVTFIAMRVQSQDAYDVNGDPIGRKTGDHLRPGATAKETRDWLKAHLIEAALAAAIQQSTTPAAPQFSPEQIQTIKMCIIRGQIVDKLLTEQPQIKAEANALLVQLETDASKEKLPDNSSLTNEQFLLMVYLAERGVLFEQILKAHPALKPRADELYVQYNNELTTAIANAQKSSQ